MAGRDPKGHHSQHPQTFKFIKMYSGSCQTSYRDRDHMYIGYDIFIE